MKNVLNHKLVGEIIRVRMLKQTWYTSNSCSLPISKW